jgi:TolB-like protein
VAEASHAVFLSYASQDVGAARRICDALRAAGIEVWLDQSELRGGDAWDRKIRDQIRHCALFIPVISAHSQARLEGYFRREWKFAVERKRDIADELAFLLPVVIDETSERGASVPEGFHEVQWTRLPGGAASQEFIEHVSRLLTGHRESPKQGAQAAEPSPALATHQPPSGSKSDSRLRMGLLLAATAIAVIVGYIGIDRYVLHRGTAPSNALSAPAQADKSIAGVAPAATFAPPLHSIAVLPFVNMSGEKEQEYFSDGLSEELLNDLSRITELQVAGRTSSFYFKGKDVDLSTIAHKLNVGSVLEGSVRRSGHTVRVTAQLINAVTGFHLWSETYDRNLSDILQVQTEIAKAVTSALKVTLLGEVTEKIELGGTRNPNALDAFLRGRKAYSGSGAKDMQDAIAEFSEAIRLDPNYALAYSVRSRAFNDYAGYATTVRAAREAFDKAHADAQRAIALAPDLADGHLSLAVYYATGSLSFALANDEYERALALSPGYVRALQRYCSFAVAMGRTEPGIAAGRRAVVLDPLDWYGHATLATALYYARKYDEGLTVFKRALGLRPGEPDVEAFIGATYYLLGDFPNARAFCERKADSANQQSCLAVIYDKLGRRGDAEAALANARNTWGDSAATIYAGIYAQWGNTTKALEWLDTAMRQRDPDLITLKSDPWLDPLRKEPRFQAVMRELKFPE